MFLISNIVFFIKKIHKINSPKISHLTSFITAIDCYARASIKSSAHLRTNPAKMKVATKYT